MKNSVHLWTVKWMKRTGELVDERELATEMFLTWKEAWKFAAGLRKAKAFLRDCDNIHIRIERRS